MSKEACGRQRVGSWGNAASTGSGKRQVPLALLPGRAGWQPIGCLPQRAPSLCCLPPLPPAAGIIDEEKKVRHSKLADKIEEVISEPSKMEIKLKVWAALVGAG